MKKTQRKYLDNIYFSENIDSKWAVYADKGIFLLGSVLFLTTFIVFFAFQILGYKGESYWLNLLQLFGGLVFLCVPLILRRFNLYVNSYLAVLWYIFMIATWYIGLNFGVYKMGEWYDKIVHLFSGAFVALFGLTFANMNGNIKNKFSVFFTVIAFATFSGLVWEIIEFTFDGIFGDNSQRFNEESTGVPFIGREALYDTMYDMIADFAGGVIIAIILMFMKKEQIAQLAIQPQSWVAPNSCEVQNGETLDKDEKNIDLPDKTNIDGNSAKIVNSKTSKK